MKALLKYEENESSKRTEDNSGIVMIREVLIQHTDETGNIISEENTYKLKVLTH